MNRLGEAGQARQWHGNCVAKTVGSNNPMAGETTLASKLALGRQWEAGAVERKLLLACVPAWKRPVWHLVYHHHPEIFQIDRWLVQAALRCTALTDVNRCVDDARYEGRRSPNFWRQSLGLQVSGRLLKAIAAAHLSA